MELAFALVISVLFALVLKKQIKRYAVAFYIIAIAVDILFVSRLLFDVSRDIAVASFPYTARCLVGFSLFAVVMYTGLFPKDSWLLRSLMPIRGELSIIAAILTIGHVVNYLGSYLDQIISGFVGMSSTMTASFIVSSLLIILLAALTITSFNVIKTRMNKSIWKNLQRTAYLFFGLTYVHLLLVLAPTIESGGQRAALSVYLYTGIMVVYAITRIVVYLRSKKKVKSGSLSSA